MVQYKIKLILTALLFLGLQTLFAQQFESQVNLVLERLPLDKQEKLKNLSDDLEVYLNDFDWTGEDFDEPVQLSLQIFFEDKSVSFEDRYAGTFLVSNNNDVQYSDKYWRFSLQAGEQLIHQTGGGHPFTSCLDFYAYIILGHEYDKFGKLLGAEYFEKAKTIAEQGLFSAQFSLGWKERNALIDHILSEKFKLFRLMKDKYYLGLSYLGEEDNTALQYCSEAVDMLVDVLRKDPEHREANQFLDANYIEMIDLFKTKPDVLRKLMRVDEDHKETYQKYINQ